MRPFLPSRSCSYHRFWSKERWTAADKHNQIHFGFGKNIRGLASPRGVFYGARLCSGRRPERSPEAPKGPRVSWLRRKLLLGPEAWARYTAVTTVDEPPRARRALGGESVTAKCPKGKRTSFCNFACQPPTICFHGLAIFHVEIWVSSRCLNRTKIWTSHV